MQNNNTVKFNIENVKIEDSVSIEKASIEVSYDTEVLTSGLKTLTDILGPGVVGKLLVELVAIKKEDQKIRKEENQLREKEADFKRRELERRRLN